MGWRINKEINVATVLMMAGQLLVLVVLLTRADFRIEALEKMAPVWSAQAETAVRMDERVKGMKEDLTEIKNLVRPQKK